MWSDIGMNLEKHDEFLNSFPGVYKRIIQPQEGRPDNMDYFNKVVTSVHGRRPYELFQHKQKGGKVFGTYCVYVPDEVLLALNGVSTGLCGGDQFWVPGGEKYLPANTCPLIKSSMGSRLDRTSPFCQVADMFIGEATCDGKKKAWEILAQDVPMHIMEVPQMKREQDIQRFAEEIWHLAEKAQEVTGNKLSYETLAQSIITINNKRRALQRLNSARQSSPVPISGKDALMVIQVAFYDDPVRFAQMANILCDELEERIGQKQGPFPNQPPRIIVTGTPMALPNWKLHHLIETSGAVVVCEESCTGTRYFENLVDENSQDLEEQIMALARRYMETNCACFTPNQARTDDILRYVKEYQADGVIDYTLQFCGLYSTESYLLRKAMKKEGLPFLHIETDYSEQDSEQLRTRIEAFIEILKD
ncbi:MAG: 2-hydroxyacyl-CoA dehydratase [Syntrophomonadaceae bacterium]|jgi:benzoyl-CoA reductase/2-hydroxyglutaryl-CoA dehydratase subunit BcrC/BadD/HgdB|nr:2-hydroxyacyl-CoA dehydratase [Syntrophomonadaceae bacterium]